MGWGWSAGSPTPWWVHPALVLTQFNTGTCTHWELPLYSNHQIFRYTPRLSKQLLPQEVAQSLLKNEWPGIGKEPSWFLTPAADRSVMPYIKRRSDDSDPAVFPHLFLPQGNGDPQSLQNYLG